MADNANEQPVLDKDGWIKSSIVVSPPEENNEADYPYKKEVKREFEKVTIDWPEGELTPGAYGDATHDNSLHIQYTYQPADAGGLGFLEIDLLIGSDAAEWFAELKEEAQERKPGRDGESQTDGWVDWPRGFPDQNDYENVSHCGATKNLGQVYWVQNTTLVRIGTAAPETTKLRDYADGVWQVVNGMGL